MSSLPASAGTQKLCSTSADAQRELDALPDRHADLVRGLEVERAARVEVAHAPPPLLADDLDAQRDRLACARGDTPARE